MMDSERPLGAKSSIANDEPSATTMVPLLHVPILCTTLFLMVKSGVHVSHALAIASVVHQADGELFEPLGSRVFTSLPATKRMVARPENGTQLRYTTLVPWRWMSV